MEKEPKLSKPAIYIADNLIAQAPDYYPEYKKLDHSSVQLISLDDLNAIKEKGDYLLPMNVSLGDVLLRHPSVPNKYIHVNQMEYEYLKEKAFATDQILCKLGCKKYDFDLDITEESNSSLKADGSIANTAKFFFNIKGSYKKELKESYKQKLQLKSTYESGVESCDKETIQKDYEKAIEIAKEYGLLEDSEIKTMIENRNPNGSNRQKTFHIHEDHSDVINKQIDFALKLDALKGLVKINGAITEVFHKRHRVILKFDVEF